METIRMTYSVEAHMAYEHVVLPCGCKITDTSVLSMCWEHGDKLKKQRDRREQNYAEFHRLLEEAATRREGK